MSVIINGLSMPHDCKHCPLATTKIKHERGYIIKYLINCNGTDSYHNPEITERRPDACLLIETNDQWSLCSERLPEDANMKLVTVKRDDEDFRRVFPLWWHNGEWLTQDAKPFTFAKPIAWMNAPKPYIG